MLRSFFGQLRSDEVRDHTLQVNDLMPCGTEALSRDERFRPVQWMGEVSHAHWKLQTLGQGLYGSELVSGGNKEDEVFHRCAAVNTSVCRFLHKAALEFGLD